MAPSLASPAAHCFLPRPSTHLPILKLLWAVDSLQGPRLDSLRLLEQLRSQDWREEDGRDGLTFNHLKVGPARGRDVPKTQRDRSHVWKRQAMPAVPRVVLHREVPVFGSDMAPSPHPTCFWHFGPMPDGDAGWEGAVPGTAPVSQSQRALPGRRWRTRPQPKATRIQQVLFHVVFFDV